MNERIERLCNFALKSELYPESVAIECDPFDEKLPEPMKVAKRLCDYIAAQPVILNENSELIGLIRFYQSPVPADIFSRSGHTYFWEVADHYYGNPLENLCTFEWQHSNPDLGKVVRLGLHGYIQEINESRLNHIAEPDHLDFLSALEAFIHGMRKRVEQYRAFCEDSARKTSDPARKAALQRMAANLEQVPMHPAKTFEQAIQTCYICWQCLSDSIGRPDQYLYPLYKHDMEAGILTREHAKELIQEFFITIHRFTQLTSIHKDKGAESHFVLGGYTIDHEDGWNELSDLIIESMMEMPLIRPQVSLRWNNKTPFSVLYKMLDYERKDKNKRIAFANDEPRLKSMMKLMNLKWEDAYNYIVVGCNEPAFQGGISLMGNTTNMLRSITDVFEKHGEAVLECQTFDEFYQLWEKCLLMNLETSLEYSNRFNMLRSRDCNIMSSLFLDGCIQRAKSATQGGARLARTGFSFMGGTNVIDSLCIVKQFVFEEKRCTMAQLSDALKQNWQGYESLRGDILKYGRFFGNNDDFSNNMAQRVNESLFRFADGRLEHFGNPIVFGNLTGYNPHFAWFGERTSATPDGRLAGAPMTFGSGQSFGKDKDGVSSHLLSVATCDPTGIMCGSSIMNLTMDTETIQNDESFEKFARLVETYFRAGGLHLQLNYVSREELLDAQKNPDAYQSLRVRVSGFSAYFTNLRKSIQDNVIDRTSGKM